MKKTFDVILCRHRGFWAWLIRFVTKSEFDHITLARPTRKGYEFYDFNYPGFHVFFEEQAPWELCSFVCTVNIPYWRQISDGKESAYYSAANALHLLSTKKYSLLFNLNWLTWRLFRCAPFRGWNCVAFVSCFLGTPNHFKYKSPAELASGIKRHIEFFGQWNGNVPEEEDNALSS